MPSELPTSSVSVEYAERIREDGKIDVFRNGRWEVQPMRTVAADAAKLGLIPTAQEEDG